MISKHAQTIAESAVYYPKRPTTIDLVGVLAAPHFEQHYRGDVIAAAEAADELLAKARAFLDATAGLDCIGCTLDVDLERARHELNQALVRAEGGVA